MWFRNNTTYKVHRFSYLSQRVRSIQVMDLHNIVLADEYIRKSYVAKLRSTDDPWTIHGQSSIAASIRLTKQRVAKLSLCRDGRKSNKFRRRFVRDALRRERRSRSPLGNNVAVLIPYVETTCSFCD